MKRFCRYLPHGRREAASPWLLCLLLGLIETAVPRDRVAILGAECARLRGELLRLLLQGEGGARR